MAAHMVLAKFNGLTNSYMTTEERAADDPTSREHAFRVWGSKIQLIGWSFYVMILWLVKASIAVFYSRLTYVSIYLYTSRLSLMTTGGNAKLKLEPGCYICPHEFELPMVFWV